MNSTTKLLALLLVIFTVSCEDKKSEFTCNYYGLLSSTTTLGSIASKPKHEFSSTAEAISVVDSILNQVGLARNFQIMPSTEVDNAAAIVFEEKRFILYNSEFMKLADEISNNSWASISILAHEIGHHLQGHTLTNDGSRPPIELEADKFSGFVLARMGAKLQDAQSAVLSLVSEQGSETHPKRSDRLMAIASGFKNGAVKSSSKKSILDLKPIIKPSSDSSIYNSLKLSTKPNTKEPLFPISQKKVITPAAPKFPSTGSALDNRFLGKHLFNAYFMDAYNSFGEAECTKSLLGYHIKGRQQNAKGDWVTIEGFINNPTLTEFSFSGTIKVYHPAGAQSHNKFATASNQLDAECSWTGKSQFKVIYTDTKYWRMQDKSFKCYPLTGDIDLFFE